MCHSGYCLISPGKSVSYTSLDMMETEANAPQKMVPCSAVRIKRDPEGCSYLSGCVFSLEMQPPSGARCGFVLFSLVGRGLGGELQTSPIFVDRSQSVLRLEAEAELLCSQRHAVFS